MAQAAKRKKLYIDLDGSDFLLSPSIGVRRFFAFNVTQTTVGTVPDDKYGGFLDSLSPISSIAAGAPGEVRRPADVSAWFQKRPGSAVASLLANSEVAVDFIAATGVATTLNGIDPVTTRNFRVRLTAIRMVSAAGAGGQTSSRLIGRLYVQRQHSIEV
jgi:hypothetical protein